MDGWDASNIISDNESLAERIRLLERFVRLWDREEHAGLETDGTYQDLLDAREAIGELPSEAE